MLPTIAETIVILIICICTFALANLGPLGEAVWKLRCRLSPDLAEGTDRRDEPED